MKKFFAAAAVAAVAAMAVAATASADVPRYQLQTGTITVTWAGSLVHVFTINSPGINPCDGSFTAEGTSTQGTLQVKERVVGTLIDGVLTYTATYHDMTDYNGYWWHYSGPLSGGFGTSSMGEHYSISIVTNLATPVTYKNHGDYVNGGGDPQSCIGRPIAWSTTGTVDSSSMAGTNVTLPDVGTYRITVSGDWQGDPQTYNRVDAEYTTSDAWATVYSPNTDQGDLQVNGQFVDWGAYNPNHVYSLTTSFTGMTLNLAVFDGDPSTNTKNPSWYTDNVGSLNYTITYVGP